MSKIDNLLDDIRKNCELGDIDSVIYLSEELKYETKRGILTPYDWLLNKFSIKKGSTFLQPNISLRQCAGFISEYNKKYQEKD